MSGGMSFAFFAKVSPILLRNTWHAPAVATRLAKRKSQLMRIKPVGAKKTCRLTLEELEARLVLSVPRPDHVVIVIESNHSYSDIIGSSSAPYINNTLAAQGALMTNSFGIEQLSQP